jgi:single-strand DNA-binding protein
VAINNSVTLKGNLGAEARIIETSSKPFAAISLATTDSYKDANDEWQQKETIWHNIIAFSPATIQILKKLKEGSRIEVLGSLSYRAFHALDDEGNILTNNEGRPIMKKEASIIAHKIILAPLLKKG